MNLLSLVMGLLLIFACTFTLSLRKEAMSKGVEKTYQAHTKASRKILNSYESICYERMREEKKEPQKEKNTNAHHEPHAEPLNLDCARLNLWPLLQDGKEKHLILYETTAQLLRTFYGKSFFPGELRWEYRLLDVILASAQMAALDPGLTHIPLEKLSLKESNVKQLYSLQMVYYRMLKGTKKQTREQGYPSLLEYFVAEKKETHLCLQHASIEMLRALFSERIAPILYRELKEKEIPLLPERIREICTQNGLISLSDDFIQLLDLHSSRHQPSGQKTLVKEAEDVCLKQRVFLPS